MLCVAFMIEPLEKGLIVALAPTMSVENAQHLPTLDRMVRLLLFVFIKCICPRLLKRELFFIKRRPTI